MPLYEYECSGCGRRFEIKQPMESPVELRCPQCEQRAKRIVAPFSWTFREGPRSKVNPNARPVGR